MVNHIHIYLISGFLGAGKTTLLQRFLNHYSYRKVAVLKNECGEVNVDSQFISQMGVQIIEIANGSIFCTCRHDTFIEAMKNLANFPIEMLFIESSGIADPANFGKDLQLLLDLVGPIFHHLGNICLVDASSFLELVDVMPAMENQVKFSGVVLLNKIDLVTEDIVIKIENKIKEFNATAKIIRTQYAAMDLVTLESIIGPLCSVMPLPQIGVNTEQNKPRTIVLNAGSPQNVLDPILIRKFFEDFLSDTLRIKGFFHGSPGWMFIDGVQSQLQINSVPISPSIAEIVVIFRPDTDITLLDMVQNAWNQKFGEKK